MPEGKTLVAALSTEVLLWDLVNGRRRQHVPVWSATGGGSGMALTADGSAAFLGDGAGLIVIDIKSDHGKARCPVAGPPA
jgi:hypothetical protein